MPQTKTKQPKPAAAEAPQPEPRKPTPMDLRVNEATRQLDEIQKFIGEFTEMSITTFEALKTFKLILDRERGSFEPQHWHQAAAAARVKRPGPGTQARVLAMLRNREAARELLRRLKARTAAASTRRGRARSPRPRCSAPIDRSSWVQFGSARNGV
jgi:hypothetical protein